MICVETTPILSSAYVCNGMCIQISIATKDYQYKDINTSAQSFQQEQLSNEKNPGCLWYIGDYTTQLYGDCNKPLQGSLLTIQYNGK